VVVDKGHPPATHVLADGDLNVLLKACAGHDFYARRDLVMIRLMLATGLRVSELADIGLVDVDLPNRIVCAPRQGRQGARRAVRPADGSGPRPLQNACEPAIGVPRCRGCGSDTGKGRRARACPRC
jgi:integrase